MVLLLVLSLAAQSEDIAALERRMVELINVERDARALPLLASHPELSDVARRYSRRMVETGRVDHGADRPMEARILEPVKRFLEGRVDFGDTEQNVSVDGNFGSLVNAQGTMPDPPHQLPAAPAQLIAPEDRQVLEGDLANYNFAWATVGNAAGYHLEVSADSEFKQLPSNNVET